MGDEEIHALRGVSIQIERGEYVAIMGPSGSGKSTLMNLIGCLDTPTQGLVPAERQAGQPDERQRARADPQRRDRVRLPDLQPAAARDGAAQRRAAAGLRRRVVEGSRRAREAGAREGGAVARACTHRPNELSGGQRQRVAIARALVNNPSILLADEPTGQPRLEDRRGDHGACSRKLHQAGNTIILVTHEADIAAHAHRVIHIRDGQVEKDTRQAA